MRASNEGSTSAELMSTPFRNRPQGIDLVAAVKGLHELSPQQLTKLLRDSGSNIVRHVGEDGSPILIDLEKFAKNLPLHLIAVIMSWEKDKSTFKYLLCGILLQHSMCDVASRVPKIDQILLDDVKVSEQLIDLVFFLLVRLATHRQENNTICNETVLLHSALVACGLKLLTAVVSPQYEEVAQVLVAYYKVDIFMEAAFSAVRQDVKFLQTKLSAEQYDTSANISPADEETLNHLCQQCDSSLQFLQSLCQQMKFRERIMHNKEFCRNGGFLMLVQAIMSLKMSPLHNTSSYIARVSRLQSKVLSIFLYLCEAETNYLDEVVSNSRSLNLAKSIALQVFELLKKMFGIDSEHSTSSGIIYPKGQLEINAMRLADVFSDDSNFRLFTMTNFTEALAAIFLLPHGEFISGWCSSDLPVFEDDATLEVPRASYAHIRTSLLIKVIANLHCFVPDVCQDEKDLFLNKFVRFVQKEFQILSDGSLSSLDAEKTTTVGKNLCSLLSHAESLVPQFSNEEDVHLLRLFISRFEPLIVPAASEDQDVQITGVHPSPLHREVAPNHGNNDTIMEERMLENAAFQQVDQLDGSRNGNVVNGERKSGVTGQGRTNETTANLGGIERDVRPFDTSGSDSSPTRGKRTIDHMDVDQIRGSGFDETMEDERSDAIHSDGKQQRKRKRTIMNDIQIALIESALVDEPDMHRNSTSLRSWADKLSLHGAEVTTSRLKNWLNNRKAKLARAAKDNLDRQGGNSGNLNSPTSPMDDARIPSSARGNVSIEAAATTSADVDLGAPLAAPRDKVVISSVDFEPGQFVVLVSENSAEEIGKGKVFQVRGNWCGKNLEECGMCVVDVMELSIDQFSNLMHPVEATGNSFYQAQQRLGLMRVLWDSDKLFHSPPR